jgi:acetyltransferase
VGTENLSAFFKPQTIAVIGASNRLDSLGGKVFRNLVGHYQGLIFPVNPFRQIVQGVRAFPSVDRLPSKPDLAIVATPAHIIPQIIEECGKAAIPGVIVISAGFDETSSSGKDLTDKILELKKVYGLRIMGPNSFGVIRPKINLYATFGEKKAIPGKIAFISQSAALCGSVLDWSFETQVGLSAVVSTGNSLDVDISDLIDYFGEDPQTRTILLYIEDLKHIRRFMSAARGFARTKPIILVKAGRFRRPSSFSVYSYEDRMFDAVFRRIGLVRVDTVAELFDCGKALSMQPSPTEQCLTIVTNASGPGLMAADELKSRGGELSETVGSASETLKNVLPYYCNVSNPIDVLEEAAPERFRKVMQVCIDDPNVKNLLMIYTSLGATDPSCIASIAMELSAQKRKTFLACIMGEDAECQQARRSLNQKGIPAFRAPEEAASTLMYMHEYTRNLELLYQTPDEIPLPPDAPARLKSCLRRACCEGRQILSLPESFHLLETYRIPTLKWHFAQTAGQARDFASKIGYPVTMRALNNQSHCESKREVLSYDAWSASEVETVFDKIGDEIRNSIDPAEFHGIIIQPKLRTEGLNLFIGSKKDPKFGTMILFGMGGAVKISDETMSLGFPPLNQILAKQIVDHSEATLYMQAWLKSHNFPKAGIIEETLVKLSQLVIDFPEIRGIDIDPLFLDEKGIYAVNASITIERDRVMHEADHYEHLIVAPYPKKYVTRATLKNGLQVKLRPIKPEDENRFKELFKSLSEESVRFRFFETIRELSHDTLTRYCNLDYDREIAIVAELKDERKIVGVVRIIPDNTGKSGEFAIMVGDAWHGLGLGSKFMDLISDISKDLKLETIYSYVTRSNSKMINLCKKKGFKIGDIDDYTINMSKNL